MKEMTDAMYTESNIPPEIKASLVIHKSNLKIPYEYLNRIYRKVQRAIEIQMANISSVVSKGTYTIKSLRRMRENLFKLQQQLEEYGRDIETICKNSLHIIESCIMNSENISKLTSAYNSSQESSQMMLNLDVNLQEIFKSHLMLYFFENKYPLTAIKYSKHVWQLEGIENKWFQTSSQILSSIQRKQTYETNSWMCENKNRLKKTDSKLEFLLQRQEFLKYLEDNNISDALKFAQKWPKNQTFMSSDLIEKLKVEELPKLLGLLAFSDQIQDGQIDTERYAEFLNSDIMWNEVLNQFHRDNLQIFSDFSPSLLTTIVVFGISILKSNMCNYSENEMIRNFSNSCPICTSDIKYIASQVPSCNWLISKILCAQSKDPADQTNPPMLAPSGFVYSREQLERYKPDEEHYACGITSKVYNISEFKKLYIM